MNESASQKLWKRRAKNALGNRRSDFHFSHSFNNNKLDDRDHFQQNAKTSVASLRGLIGSSRNVDRHHSGILIDFIGIPTNGAAFMGSRYVFVTVQFSANKCAIELYENPEKGEKMTCLSVLWKSDPLFSSQWIWGDGQFF